MSLLIPCYNESAFIEGVIRDILNQTWSPEDMEVFFIDGGSTDDTRDKLQVASAEYPFIKLLDNPDQYVPQAMNIGIRESVGTIIIRLDAHGSYPPDYVKKLVESLQETGADNVGGIWETKARSNKPKARAIAAILSHRFGVGNALFRLGVDKPMEVDTVPFGCYPRDVFEKYGMYDERLVRNQDIELNKRIRRKGGKILLIPEVSSVYYARDRFRAFWRNNYQTGRWVPLTIAYTGAGDSLSLRHFIPFFFAGYLLLLMLFCAFANRGLCLIFSIPLCFYILLIALSAFQIGRNQKSLKTGLFALYGFPLLHLAYGIGTWQGLFESIGLYLKGNG
ncbi:MAG: glycosyltransferase family 2 protein [Bacteroidetes bacterium]|nr:glycosyltransferase family 2 protein [Bacteroidota bacterium]